MNDACRRFAGRVRGIPASPNRKVPRQGPSTAETGSANRMRGVSGGKGATGLCRHGGPRYVLQQPAASQGETAKRCRKLLSGIAIPKYGNGHISRAASRSWSCPLHCSTAVHAPPPQERGRCSSISAHHLLPAVFWRKGRQRSEDTAAVCPTKPASGALQAVPFAQVARQAASGFAVRVSLGEEDAANA